MSQPMKKKILIVDDEDDILHFLDLVLREKGYDVATASGGHEALTKAQLERPDLVLLDIMMPGRDGYEVCKILKADQATRAIPVIILTAEESVELNQMAFEAGAQATVLKSMSHDRLMNIVDVFIQTGTSSGPS